MEQVVREKSKFYQRLNLLGFDNYDAYLRSEHWKNKRLEYANSNRPKRCAGCNSRSYSLHHRSYVRLGDESLNDLIPLCRNCHQKVHDYLKNSGAHIHSPKVFRDVFNLSKSETRKLLKKFTRFKGSTRFRDNLRVDILKQSSENSSCITYDKVGEDKDGNWLVVRRDKKNDKPAILSEYNKINGY